MQAYVSFENARSLTIHCRKVFVIDTELLEKQFILLLFLGALRV
jgi:hypothetical protein